MHNQYGVGPCEWQFLQRAEFAKYSIESNLRDIAGKKIIFDSEGGLVPMDGWQSCLPDIPQLISTIKPAPDGSLVAAVDSSTVRIAETDEGVLYAAKCGVALAHAKKPLMHIKIGPSLFYMTEKAVENSVLNQRLARLVLL